MSDWKGLITGVFMVAAAAGLGGLAVSFNQSAHPPSQGAQWLQTQGYSNIKGGEASYFNACGKNIMSRTYQVTDAEGQRIDKTVCFGLFGAHSPLFGS